MIGDGAVALWLDKVFAIGANVISSILNFIVSAVFANRFIGLLICFVLINILAVVLMKKDKEYAGIEGAKRISERTLLVTAFVGGAFGEYYAMYKYKHKTLHKKFLYGVPLAIVFHFALISYNILLGILA
ncbi:MAG: DUF1294 domain-containing protein [Clostridia bacterium]|nr:DUF1294 domain-containing protein [Clostridia bacterium]